MRTPLTSSLTSSCDPALLELLARGIDAFGDGLADAALLCFASEWTRSAGFRLREISDGHRWQASALRDVATAFRTADSAQREYNARIHRVERSISAWLPLNRDRARAEVARTARRRLLTFDPAKDGRVVEVFGNITTSTHIAVIVPGMDNDITDYLGLRVRAENLRAEMARIAAAGQTVAVVLWLGYDTPDLSVTRLVSEGGGSQKAKAGAKVLLEDIAFLRRVSPGAEVTVVGHSYGTVVVGRAMRAGLDVDRVVAVGSPGMDARDRRDLKSPKVSLWATRHRGEDLIPLVPTHGEDPAARGFHAKRFRSDGVKHHSDYFRKESVALGNIARIATGAIPETEQVHDAGEVAVRFAHGGRGD